MPYIYPFDPNGVLASNLISNEVHVVTAPTAPDSANFIVPSFGPFFGNSLVVEQVNGSVITALVQGVDYQLGAQWFEMRSSFSQSVYAAISFMNLSFSGNVRITYQTVGGPYTDVDQSLLLNLTQSLYKLRNINWSQIVGPLVQFPVEPHNHSVVDVVANDVVLKLDEIAQAIQDNPSAAGALSDGSTISGSGIIGNPLAVKLSTTAGNKLQSTPQGLYVPTTTVPALVTDTSTLSGTGVTGSPLTVKITDISDNILEAASDGLYVPKSYFSVNDFTGDATQFNGIQIKVDSTAPNALYKGPDGLLVPPEAFTKAWTSDIGITGSGYTNSKISLVRNPAPNNILQIDADGLYVPAPSSVVVPTATTGIYGKVRLATTTEKSNPGDVLPADAVVLTVSEINDMITQAINTYSLSVNADLSTLQGYLQTQINNVPVPVVFAYSGTSGSGTNTVLTLGITDHSRLLVFNGSVQYTSVGTPSGGEPTEAPMTFRLLNGATLITEWTEYPIIDTIPTGSGAQSWWVKPTTIIKKLTAAINYTLEVVVGGPGVASCVWELNGFSEV